MRFNGCLRRLALILVVPFSFIVAPPAPAATLDVAKLPIVQGATFEVVVARPDDSAVRYEKPIPLEKLPFQYRNDKYDSIGTAFAIGGNRFVTAFHVIHEGIGGRAGAPFLRDAKGKVYTIDKVTGFSLSQDFVVFTVLNPPAIKPLATDRASHLNEVVYAVGNALGTGVVIRDGLYTSDTPEDENGRWKWIRFSAAASPGNSGGPLLDKDGKVIGIVLRKSPSENLNYALPIGMVLDASTTATDSEQRSVTRADFMDATLSDRFHIHYDLPLSFADFDKGYQAQADKSFDAHWKALFAQEDAKLFPNGDGSKKVLAGAAPLNDFPAMLARGANGDWDYWLPDHHHATMSGNGYVDAGLAGSVLMIHLRKPDDLPLARLYADAAGLTDLIFKASPFSRDVGDEKIKVTSLGKPLRDTVYVDRWKRHWQHRDYAMPVTDTVLQVYSLPVPDGYVILARESASHFQHSVDVQTESLANMITVSYDGSFAAWKEFLQQGDWVPPDIAAAGLAIDYGKNFAIAPTGFSLHYGPDLQPIEANGQLTVSYGFLSRNGNVAPGIASVIAQPDMDKQTQVRLTRYPKPFADSARDYRSDWKDAAARAHPEDSQPYKNDVMTWIGTTIGGNADADVLYTLFYGSDTNPSDAVMKQKLAKAIKAASVQEH